MDHDAVANDCRNLPVPKPFEGSADRLESGERVIGDWFRRWFIALLRRLEAVRLLAGHRDRLGGDTKKGLETSVLASNPLGYVRLMAGPSPSKSMHASPEDGSRPSGNNRGSDS